MGLMDLQSLGTPDVPAEYHIERLKTVGALEECSISLITTAATTQEH